MKRDTEYKTKQKGLIFDKVKNNGAEHFTVDSIAEQLENDGTSVGKSTVYRFLEKLSEDGFVKKYTVDGERSICYQYVGENSDCHNHYHLKCEKCGKLIHMECESMDKMSRHIFEEHKFKLNGAKCMLYGVCEDCQRCENNRKQDDGKNE